MLDQRLIRPDTLVMPDAVRVGMAGPGAAHRLFGKLDGLVLELLDEFFCSSLVLLVSLRDLLHLLFPSDLFAHRLLVFSANMPGGPQRDGCKQRHDKQDHTLGGAPCGVHGGN